MPKDGSHCSAPLGRRTLFRTVSSMMLAGYVTPPTATGFSGPDARFLAAEAEVERLLSLDSLTAVQVDRLEQLDDWIAFMPAASIDGAAVKLRRLLCPREGLFTGRMHRLSGADQAALNDALRVVGAMANRSPVNALVRGRA